MTVPRHLVAEPAFTYVVRDRQALPFLRIPDEPGNIVVTFIPDRPTAPDTDAAFKAAMEGPSRVGHAGWREVLDSEGGVVTAAQMASLLGISRQAVDKRRRVGTLLGFRDAGREFLYPVWQVRDGATLPGLAPVLSALRAGEHDPVSQFVFFLTAFPRLGDRRPVDLLRMDSGREIDEVVGAALGYLEQGAA